MIGSVLTARSGTGGVSIESYAGRSAPPRGRDAPARIPGAWLTALFLGVSVSVQAALHDRGGGLIYDDVLDITWLQDANYAVTSGAHPNGRMPYDLAMSWVQNLSYYDPVRNITWGDWRLPRMLPVNGVSYNFAHQIDGSADIGFNIASPASELGYMFHVNLGGVPYTDIFGNWPQPGYGLPGAGPFLNLGPVGFWSETVFEPFSGHALGFVFLTGSQHHGAKAVDQFYAWPVRDGDVAAEPPPNVTFVTPTHGGTVSGVVDVTVAVSGMDAKRVVIVAAGSTLCGDSVPPFSCRWDTTAVANGTYVIQATAIEANANRKSKRIVVGVTN
jgi:hypothetical protein